MNELRWILITASVVLLAWIYWQGRRKGLAAESGETSQRREFDPPQLTDNAVVRVRGPLPSVAIDSQPAIKIDDLPEVRIGAAPATLSMEAALSTSALERLTLTRSPPVVEAVPPRPTTVPVLEDPQSSAKAPNAPNADKPRSARKIVALRVAAAGQPFSGEQLKEWFAEHDLRYGKFDIFHRYDEHGDVLFSVASMVEPGTFDRATMIDMQYPGVSLFVQLPSSVDGVDAFDEMLACAHALQNDFVGNVFGERNAPLTNDLIERMRDGVADFQHLVSTPRPRS